jgi:hypothetical protein
MTPDMRACEYAPGLFSVLIGLAVVDIATSVHRLVRRRSVVRWDSLPLLAALYAALSAPDTWVAHRQRAERTLASRRRQAGA